MSDDDSAKIEPQGERPPLSPGDYASMMHETWAEAVPGPTSEAEAVLPLRQQPMTGAPVQAGMPGWARELTERGADIGTIGSALLERVLARPNRDEQLEIGQVLNELLRSPENADALLNHERTRDGLEQVLTGCARAAAEAGAAAAGATAELRSDDNFTGTGYVATLKNLRYVGIPDSTLRNNGLWLNTSSARLSTVEGKRVSLVLFSSYPLWAGPYINYEGSFVQINSGPSHPELSIPSLASRNFDNQTHSALLIQSGLGEEQVLPLQLLLRDRWIKLIDEKLAGSKASRNNQEPTITWAMFPQGIPELSSSGQYVRISQPLTVNPFLHYIYQAAITYHIRLYADASRMFTGSVAREALWVSDGFYHDDIVNALTPKVKEGTKTINELLATELPKLVPRPLVDVYYLPGSQLSPPVDGAIFKQSTWADGATVVVQFQP